MKGGGGEGGLVSLPAEWLSALIMEEASTPETSVSFYQATRCNIQEDRDKLKPRTIDTGFVLSAWCVPVSAHWRSSFHVFQWSVGTLLLPATLQSRALL
jgi:hypothetical protein